MERSLKIVITVLVLADIVLAAFVFYYLMGEVPYTPNLSVEEWNSDLEVIHLPPQLGQGTMWNLYHLNPRIRIINNGTAAATNLQAKFKAVGQTIEGTPEAVIDVEDLLAGDNTTVTTYFNTRWLSDKEPYSNPNVIVTVYMENNQVANLTINFPIRITI